MTSNVALRHHPGGQALPAASLADDAVWCCCFTGRPCRKPGVTASIHTINLLCSVVLLLNNSLYPVGSDGAPRSSRCASSDVAEAVSTPQCVRTYTVLLEYDLADITPTRAASLHTVPAVYTGRAQRRRGTTQHFYRPTPVGKCLQAFTAGRGDYGVH